MTSEWVASSTQRTAAVGSAAEKAAAPFSLTPRLVRLGGEQQKHRDVGGGNDRPGRALLRPGQVEERGSTGYARRAGDQPAVDVGHHPLEEGVHEYVVRVRVEHVHDGVAVGQTQPPLLPLRDQVLDAGVEVGSGGVGIVQVAAVHQDQRPHPMRVRRSDMAGDGAAPAVPGQHEALPAEVVSESGHELGQSRDGVVVGSDRGRAAVAGEIRGRDVVPGVLERAHAESEEGRRRGRPERVQEQQRRTTTRAPAAYEQPGVADGVVVSLHDPVGFRSAWSWRSVSAKPTLR